MSAAVRLRRMAGFQQSRTGLRDNHLALPVYLRHPCQNIPYRFPLKDKIGKTPEDFPPNRPLRS
ncbi:MAG: hypothetical protein WA974_07750, partial [Thermodesulfobacteriota bacterium]